MQNLNKRLITIYKGERTSSTGNLFPTYYTKLINKDGEYMNVGVRFSRNLDTSALSPYKLDINALTKYKGNLLTSDFSTPNYGYEPYVGKDGKKKYPCIYINNVLKYVVLEAEAPKKNEDKNEWSFVAEEEENQQPMALNSDMVENLNIDKVKDMFDDADITIKD